MSARHAQCAQGHGLCAEIELTDLLAAVLKLGACKTQSSLTPLSLVASQALCANTRPSLLWLSLIGIGPTWL